ncbi:1-acyl-sn-glycerol-3-phosphate acyltransferase [Neolewinella antarctica]|uniref:1-acyl-sn-glycerol-3-phosphate acyltransferase n=1 Tax=Neolewinella antarctica TaxID=442734 RepID=A0ABX0XGL3_9BACT|nr:1-acyl-sn-glycerol-3-phosphate acyltransferase [Neolewinella antarctica]NJC28018.1 1-acyl-sn-glycerol-3-phosphate acyltransferase [Neolewinella antarctica]
MSKLVFQLFHFMSRWMIRVFYPGLEVEGREYANHPGPTLLCGNHPNTLIDPLIAGIHLDYQTYFLANAGLWLSPVTAFLIDPFCIPVARAKDKEAGAKTGGKDEVFNRTFASLETGKIVYIAPEGFSELERKLRRLKGGAAGMALEAENRNNWELGVSMQPVCCNYESPTTCFSRAFVRFGEPIDLLQFREQYEKSPVRAMSALTSLLTKRMQDLLIQTKDKDEEHLLRPVERAIQNDAPLTVSKHHYRTKKILKSLRAMPADDREALRSSVLTYSGLLKETGQLDIEFSDHPERKLHAGTILGLPFFLYGLLNHALWLFLINLLWNKLGIDRGYKATVQCLASWFIMPITYVIQLLLFNWAFPEAWGWLYLLSLPVAGLFALKYWVTYRAFWAGRFSGSSKDDDRLRSLRAEMLAGFDYRS